jgi:hypothetical protein
MFAVHIEAGTGVEWQKGVIPLIRLNSVHRRSTNILYIPLGYLSNGLGEF